MEFHPDTSLFHAKSDAWGEKDPTAPWSGTASMWSGWAHFFSQTIPLPAGPGMVATSPILLKRLAQVIARDGMYAGFAGAKTGH